MNLLPRLLLPPFAAVLLLSALPARAQDPQPDVVYLYSAPQLDQLAGPIALYPDPLVAVILPASATPQDVTAAADYAFGSGDPRYADEQPWSNSVKALVHYRPVLQWMAQNPAWTQALGAAFAAEPGEVMQAIQRVRHQAKAAGILVSTPQQIVFEEDGEIQILPGEPDVIYVPLYDPVILEGGGYDSSCVGFGPGFPAGPWLGFGLDWRASVLVEGDWRHWHDREGWRHAALAPSAGARLAAPRRWQPPERRAAAPAVRPAPPRFQFHPPAGAPVPPGNTRRREEFPQGVNPQPRLEHQAAVPPREAPRQPVLPPEHADATRLGPQPLPGRAEERGERRPGEVPGTPGAPRPGAERRPGPPAGRPPVSHPPAAAPHPAPPPSPPPAQSQSNNNSSGSGDSRDRH